VRPNGYCNLGSYGDAYSNIIAAGVGPVSYVGVGAGRQFASYTGVLIDLKDHGVQAILSELLASGRTFCTSDVKSE